MSKDQKIKHLEGVIYRLTYKNKPDELYEMINSELNNEHGSEIPNQQYVKDLNNTKRKLGIDSFKESKKSFKQDMTDEIDRLKFRK
ncbi:hypothetical protein ACFQ1R_11700 [Mariniflexile jejuense]|uniref:Uncharacterized protein n=1 Tax=Mariniflexile jejuense TaxID=1173582 RepID=A0ABW3JLH0_9FLAO